MLGPAVNRQPGFRRGLVEQSNATKNNPAGWLPAWLPAWPAGWLAGSGCLGWLAGSGWLVGAGSVAAWLTGCLAGLLVGWLTSWRGWFK